MDIERIDESYLFVVDTEEHREVFKKYMQQFVTNKEALDLLGIELQNSDNCYQATYRILQGKMLITTKQWIAVLRKVTGDKFTVGDLIYDVLAPSHLRHYRCCVDRENFGNEQRISEHLANLDYLAAVEILAPDVDVDKINPDLNEYC